MSDADFPTQPFYIKSKIGLSDWALTVENGAVKTKHLEGTIDFLWSAQKDPRGGSILKHIGTGHVLTCQLETFLGIRIPTGPLTVSPLDTANSCQLWRPEPLGEIWRGINTLLNWEMKINVPASNTDKQIGLYSWDGGADNEEWLFIAETAKVETVSVTYQLDLAKADLLLPPKISSTIDEDNREGSVPLTGSKSHSTSVTETVSVTNSASDTTGTTYTQTFSVSGGLDKVFEVTASASFEENRSKTVSFSEEKSKSTTETVTETVNFNVPPGKKYGYQLVVYYGKCDVPYTAQMKFQSVVPNTKPVMFTTEGVFTGVNKTKVEVVVRDLTNAKAPLAESLIDLIAVGGPKA